MSKTAPKPEPELNPESELLKARTRAQSIVSEIRQSWREPARVSELLAEALCLPERIGFYVGALEVQRQLDGAREAESLDAKAEDFARRASEAEGKAATIRDEIDRQTEMGRANILRAESTKARKLAEARRKSCEWLGKSDTARTIADLETRKTYLNRRMSIQSHQGYDPTRDHDFTPDIPTQLATADTEIARLREKAERRGTVPSAGDASTWGPQAQNLRDNTAQAVRMKLFAELWGAAPLLHGEVSGD